VRRRGLADLSCVGGVIGGRLSGARNTMSMAAGVGTGPEDLATFSRRRPVSKHDEPSPRPSRPAVFGGDVTLHAGPEGNAM